MSRTQARTTPCLQALDLQCIDRVPDVAVGGRGNLPQGLVAYTLARNTLPAMNSRFQGCDASLGAAGNQNTLQRLLKVVSGDRVESEWYQIAGGCVGLGERNVLDDALLDQLLWEEPGCVQAAG